jgi:hypothetical protein
MTLACATVTSCWKRFCSRSVMAVAKTARYSREGHETAFTTSVCFVARA